MVIYAEISKATVKGARDRALQNIEALTGGEAEKVIALVEEYNELNRILEKIKDKERRGYEQ